MRNIGLAGQADLRRLIDEMATQLEMTVGEVLRFGPFLSRAWIAGAKAFQTEMLAREIEAGGDFPEGFDEGEVGKEGEVGREGEGLER
ncbi:MAG TPA: hypothetical protein VK889_03280 [Solirubrobacterales bacterium]|nr:hypothetical protein [Solirubrobacterales bacterium]